VRVAVGVQRPAAVAEQLTHASDAASVHRLGPPEAVDAEREKLAQYLAERDALG